MKRLAIAEPLSVSSSFTIRIGRIHLMLRLHVVLNFCQLARRVSRVS